MTGGAPFPLELGAARGGCRRALVLEGGGARGAFQAGVLWYLNNHPERFPVDLISGTSVGALNAAAFAFGKCEELVRLWSTLHTRQVYRRRSGLELAAEFLRRGTFTHLYDISPLRRLLEDIFGDRLLAESPMPLLLSAFNLQTGHPVVFDENSPIRVVDALLASSALQGLFPPHTHRGFQYLDGGNGLNLPLAPALAAGARDLLLVRMTMSHDFTPWSYRDIVGIQKRAYSIMLGRTTTSDLSRARELSDVLSAAALQRDVIATAIQTTVSSAEERRTLLEGLDLLPPLVEGKHPLRLRVLEPPTGVPVPELLEFDPTLSLNLLRLGYQRAHELLEEADV